MVDEAQKCIAIWGPKGIGKTQVMDECFCEHVVHMEAQRSMTKTNVCSKREGCRTLLGVTGQHA